MKKVYVKNLLSLILLFSSLSCSSLTAGKINPEFDPYVKDFQILVPEFKDQVEKVDIDFYDFKKKEKNFNTIGRCNYNLIEPNSITIDVEYWGYSSPTSKYFTVLHEIGHCVCHLPHSEVSTGFTGWLEDFLFDLGIWKKKGYLNDGCPASIMHPSEFSEFCALNHYYYYLEEFRQSCIKRR